MNRWKQAFLGMRRRDPPRNHGKSVDSAIIGEVRTKPLGAWVILPEFRVTPMNRIFSLVVMFLLACPMVVSSLGQEVAESGKEKGVRKKAWSLEASNSCSNRPMVRPSLGQRFDATPCALRKIRKSLWLVGGFARTDEKHLQAMKRGSPRSPIQFGLEKSPI